MSSWPARKNILRNFFKERFDAEFQSLLLRFQHVSIPNMMSISAQEQLPDCDSTLLPTGGMIYKKPIRNNMSLSHYVWLKKDSGHADTLPHAWTQGGQNGACRGGGLLTAWKEEPGRGGAGNTKGPVELQSPVPGSLQGPASEIQESFVDVTDLLF
ncbi:Neurogenic Locus Notch-like Protein 4 [Manis pentadactyla]|nr:Neurogenic Locus Notch-like Protein 4 [Manis pentadactyla]